jgi:Xaa-Pro aminopeptidase
MFEPKTYIERRKKLKEKINSGIILFPGNDEAPMNYNANTYRFRQDSNFLYFFGLDQPGLFGFIDADNDEDILFGNDYEIEEIIWVGPQPKMAERAGKCGINKVLPLRELEKTIQHAIQQGRKVHFAPPYRGKTFFQLEKLLGIAPSRQKEYASLELIHAIADQRIIKSLEEIKEIELMVDVAHKMHTTVMKSARPGVMEREIAGKIEGIALSYGAGVSFPIILSVHGEILHNHYHGNVLRDGKMLVVDAGAESGMGYASDITRTIPVSGKFTGQQKDIYQIVLDANLKATELSAPGIPYQEVHLEAAKVIASGLKDLGLMKGNIDDAVNEGAHALFFVHGLGHLMGLDVHDMEGLGENNFGYDEEIKRSDKFGTAYLRFGKKLQAGMVVTNEPGIYFIPSLIKLWEEDKKFTEFIQYDKVHGYLNFGGIRIEDDLLVTPTSCRVLGKPIPKSIDEIEAIMQK